jgi:hypothetical protein
VRLGNESDGAPDGAVIPDSALRFRWRRTWSDVADDFIAVIPDDEGNCRVYLFTGGETQAGQWYWVANLPHRNLASGFAPTARKAALAAEAAFFAA